MIATFIGNVLIYMKSGWKSLFNGAQFAISAFFQACFQLLGAMLTLGISLLLYSHCHIHISFFLSNASLVIIVIL